jgi:hypothetical protein
VTRNQPHLETVYFESRIGPEVRERPVGYHCGLPVVR